LPLLLYPSTYCTLLLSVPVRVYPQVAFQHPVVDLKLLDPNAFCQLSLEVRTSSHCTVLYRPRFLLLGEKGLLTASCDGSQAIFCVCCLLMAAKQLHCFCVWWQLTSFSFSFLFSFFLFFLFFFFFFLFGRPLQFQLSYFEMILAPFSSGALIGITSRLRQMLLERTMESVAMKAAQGGAQGDEGGRGRGRGGAGGVRPRRC